MAESGRVLAVQGQVLPATLHDVRLVADIQLPDNASEVRVKGESKIPASSRADPPGMAGAEQSAGVSADGAGNPCSADLIVVGPGSLYTSVLPNLLVPDLADALRVSRALKFYVCNVATQPGETDGYTCGDHVRNLEKHLGGRLFDMVISNNRYHGELPQGYRLCADRTRTGRRVLGLHADLVDSENAWRHDSQKLAQVIMDLYL